MLNLACEALDTILRFWTLEVAAVVLAVATAGVATLGAVTALGDMAGTLDPGLGVGAGVWLTAAELQALNIRTASRAPASDIFFLILYDINY
jgi:hypothetical protein